MNKYMVYFEDVDGYSFIREKVLVEAYSAGQAKQEFLDSLGTNTTVKVTKVTLYPYDPIWKEEDDN